MAKPHTFAPLALLATVCICLLAAAHGQEITMRGRGPDLQPGVAIVEVRQQRQIRLRLDPNAGVYPAQIQGHTIVVRRLARKVYAPQSWHAFAQEWLEVGVATVLPIHQTGGALMAELVWEDSQQPVKEGDRVELRRLPSDAAKPLFLGLDCVVPKSPATNAHAAAPAQSVWLVANVVTPTCAPFALEWTTDTGEFLFAGGRSSGKTCRGPAMVRWRAPTATGLPPSQVLKATIRVKAAVVPQGEAVERSVVIHVAAPRGQYVESAVLPSRVRTSAKGSPAPILSQAARVAAGPLGSVYVLDPRNKRLLHWVNGRCTYVPVDAAKVTALASHEATAYLAQGSSLMACKPEAGQTAEVAPLPPAKRPIGIAFNAAGDVCIVDSGAPPQIHVRTAGGPWQHAPLGQAVDSPWLKAFCLDPLSNDLFIYDSRDRMVRQWRALHGNAYRLLDLPISAGNLPGQVGAPVAVLPRPWCDRRLDLPIQVVFADGAVTQRWGLKRKPATWAPIVSGTPRELSRMRFVARDAARAANGDVLLCGEGTLRGDKLPLVVQLSPQGEFRRMMPLPALPPRFVAVAPNGLRYLLLRRPRRRKTPEHLVVVGPEGWVVRDIGPFQACRAIASVRADRSSDNHVLIVGEKQRRESAFRIDISDPSRVLELSAAGLPGGKIPEHEAVDVASSATHIAVLDRDGKVLLFANRKPVTYLGHFDTGLRKPRAIAVLSGLTHPQAPNAEPQTYVCVLPSGKRAKSVHLWGLRRTGPKAVAADALGPFPDSKRADAKALLSSPVAMESGFPDHNEWLYVLDDGGTRLRAFDVGEVAHKMRQRLPLGLAAKPLLVRLPFEDGNIDLAIGPGGVVQIADTESHAVHTYARKR